MSKIFISYLGKTFTEVQWVRGFAVSAGGAKLEFQSSCPSWVWQQEHHCGFLDASPVSDSVREPVSEK